MEKCVVIGFIATQGASCAACGQLVEDEDAHPQLMFSDGSGVICHECAQSDALAGSGAPELADVVETWETDLYSDVIECEDLEVTFRSELEVYHIRARNLKTGQVHEVSAPDKSDALQTLLERIG